VVLGIRRLCERDKVPAPGTTPSRPLSSIFRQGVIVNALNPKTALFFLAFLPQFVDPHRGHVALQAAILGLVWVAIAAVCDAVWALGSGSLAGVLRSSARARRAERTASGGILIGLGVLATLADTAMGFAYVGVNMRGTGCSGGAYRFLEKVQNLHG